MTQTFVMALAHDALIMTVLLSAPLLIISLIIGLVISLFQAVTQIHEMTLTFVPKLIGMALAILLMGPWMLQQIVRFTARLFEMLPNMVR